jgi:hypothetical protein
VTRFYSQVPKTLVENLEFRQNLRRKANGNAKVQRQILEMCRQDTLFFINAFAWVIEPRDENPILPLVTWPTQDEYVLAMEDCIRGGHDLWVEKARAEGFTWMSTWVAVKWWLFRPMTQIGLVSKDKDTVDLPDDPGSLMGKLDWIVKSKKLPGWMLGENDWDRKITGSTMRHKNGSLFKAYAATDDVGSGGRWTFGILDEFAKFFGDAQAAMDSTQYVTNCRIFGSTYKGRQGVFYEQINEPSSTVQKFVFDWTRNPTRNEGLYRVIDGLPVAVNHANPPTQELVDRYAGRYLKQPGIALDAVLRLLKAKGFDLEGSIRSPWYDRECLRAPAGRGPMSIAEELDRNPTGSEEDFIPRTVLRELADGESKTVEEPKHRGRFVYDAETLEGKFVPDPQGDFLLWCDLIADPVSGDLKPPKEREYTEGCDISFGKGASNSAIFIKDKKTKAQAADYTTATMDPARFARLAIAIAKWFGNAYLGWEINGACGSTFTEVVIECGYGNVYRRKVEQVHGDRYKEQIGWMSRTNDKTRLLGGVDGGGLSAALINRELLIRSRDCLLECGQYVIVNGAVVHIKAKNTTRESAKGEAHGDRVIAAALAEHLDRDRPASKEVIVAPKEVAYGGWEWRRQRDREREGAQLDDAFAW